MGCIVNCKADKGLASHWLMQGRNAHVVADQPCMSWLWEYTVHGSDWPGLSQVWNPCFDVTPADLIEGIITDKGLLPQKNGAFDVPTFMQSQVGLL